MDSKRILLISHFLSITGAPLSLLRHAKYMQEAGHIVDVWSLDCYPGNALEPEYIAAGLNVRHVKNEEKEILAAMSDMGVQYDLVICNTICTYKCVRLFQQEGIPTIWFVRETVLADKWAIGNIDFYNTLKHFYNIYCPSEYTASQMQFYNKSIRVVRNAIEDEFLDYTPFTDGVRFGYIGSIRPVKGVEVLVDAFLGVCNRVRDVTLRIAGKAESQYAQSIVAKTQGNASIEWVGEIRGADKRRFFNSIDILCVPSLEEPFGLTAAEGSMYGKVVITTERTGAKCFAEGISGAMVKAGSVAALEKALLHFSNVKHKELRSLQELSRKLYLKYGTIDREREEVLKMVEENVGKTPPSPKDYLLDQMLVGHSWFSKVLRKSMRYYLNFILKLRDRGEWSNISSRCS